MTSKRVLPILAAFAGMGLVAFLAALPGWWWLVVLALAGMLGGIGVIVVNIYLLQRSQRAAVERRLAAANAPVQAATSSGADVAGTVRLLQAQYVARLDRAQSALERAAALLEREGADGDSPFARLPHGSTVLLHHLDAATLAHARVALTAGHKVAAVVADSADRERLEASGLADAITVVADAGAARHPVTVVLPGTD